MTGRFMHLCAMNLWVWCMLFIFGVGPGIARFDSDRQFSGASRSGASTGVGLHVFFVMFLFIGLVARPNLKGYYYEKKR